MTDKELRHLRRADLIDIIYELEKQGDEKDVQIKELQAVLEERTLRISNAGSIAEVALNINGVFEAAQAAADQYLLSVRAAADQYLLSVRAAADQMLAEAEAKRQELLNPAERSDI